MQLSKLQKFILADWKVGETRNLLDAITMGFEALDQSLEVYHIPKPLSDQNLVNNILRLAERGILTKKEKYLYERLI